MIGFIKLILTIFVLTALVIAGATAYQELGTKSLRGFVYDCSTGNVVSGATITLLQQTIFTWDKVHTFFATSSEDGSFLVRYNKGNTAKIHATKSGFLTAEAWSEPSHVPKIWLVRRAPSDGTLDVTYGCKRQSECLVEEEVTINGEKLVISKNACEQEATAI